MIELLDVILPKDSYLLPPRLPAGSDVLHLSFSPLCVATTENLCNPNNSVDDWRLIAFFWQWLDGLVNCHRKGSMHKDIKPRASIIGFGAAKDQMTSLNYDCAIANYPALGN